jgi:hypothetical protein
MDNYLANVYAELGYEKIIQLQEELYAFSLRLPENTALLCLGIQKLINFL